MSIGDTEQARVAVFLHHVDSGLPVRFYEIFDDDHPPQNDWAENDGAPPMRAEYPQGSSGAVDVLDFVTPVLDGDWILRTSIRQVGDLAEVVQLTFTRAHRDAPLAGARSILRRLRFGTVQDAIARWLRDPWMLAHLGDTWSSTDLRRPGRAGTDDVAYLLVCEEYTRALVESPRAPTKLMVEWAAARGEHTTSSAINAKLNRGRRRGLLTDAPPGQAGGELTDKAIELRKQLDEAEALR